MKHFIAPLLLGCTTLYFANLSYNQSHSLNELNKSLSEKQSTLDNQAKLIEKLNSEIEKFVESEQKITALNLEITRLNALLSKSNNQVKPSEIVTKQEELLFAKKKNQPSSLEMMARKIQAQSKAGKKLNFVDDALAAFENEAINHSWASDTEQNITQLFSENPELADTTLVNSECRSEHCKIILLPNQQSPMTIGINFSRLLNNYEWSKDQLALFNHHVNEAGEMTIIYKKSNL